jgi:hypothetical protein
MYVVVHYTITQILGDVEISEFLQELVAETSFKNILTGMKVTSVHACIDNTSYIVNYKDMHSQCKSTRMLRYRCALVLGASY